MWRAVMYLSLVGVVVGCDVQRDKQELQEKINSLRAELQVSHRTMETLQEVAVLMDSIDANRIVLDLRTIEGTSLNEYTFRMKDIQKYIAEAQDKIAILETRIQSLKGSYSGYKEAIEKLKSHLKIRNQELLVLQEKVTQYRNKNDNLIQTVTLQEASLADKINQIGLKENEIVTLKKNASDLLTKSKLNEAESYYLRARAVEEAAKRTRFAPRKKKDTEREALELYKMAAFYGKEEAQDKIAELEKKI